MLTDAGPLIFLSKLTALDTLAEAGHRGQVTPAVELETARPALGYRFPDAIAIAEALRRGVLDRLQPSDEEQREAERLTRAASGLHAGECEVLAVSVGRDLPVLLHERQAIRVGRALRLDVWTPLELLFAGTPDADLLEARIRLLAGLVQMRLEEMERLLMRVERRRR